METMFVKSTWHVGEPYTSAYSAWTLQHEPRAVHNITDNCFDVRPRAIALLCSSNDTALVGCP